MSKESVTGNGAANKQLFRSAVGGYNREDVNSYISRMDSNFHGIEQTLKNTITTQQSTIDTLNAELAELREAAGSIEAERTTAAELEKMLESCRTSIADRYREVVTEREKNGLLLARITELEASLAEQSNKAEPERAEADNEALANAMLEEANKRAAVIVREANEQRNAELRTAREDAVSIRRASTERLCAMAEECRMDVLAKMRDAQSELSALEAQLLGRYEELERDLSNPVVSACDAVADEQSAIVE